MTANFEKPASNLYGPLSNFFRSWGKDYLERWVYVGLDHEETQELLRLQGAALQGDDLIIVKPGGGTESSEETDRYLELHDKHEIVRHQICAREAAASRGLSDKPH